MKYLLFTATAISLLLSSCSIKEQRDQCPTWITFDFRGDSTRVWNIHYILGYGNGAVIHDTIPSEHTDSLYEIAVPRGEVNIGIFANIRSMLYANGFVTPAGNCADTLYTQFTNTSFMNDYDTLEVSLHKDYIATYIKVMEYPPERGMELKITSSSIGRELDGSIISGNFIHSPSPYHTPTTEEPYYCYYSQITRQGKNDLTLNLSGFTIEMEGILQENGIDMDAPSLKDLYLTIDYSKLTLTISVKGFESKEYIEIIL